MHSGFRWYLIQWFSINLFFYTSSSALSIINLEKKYNKNIYFFYEKAQFTSLFWQKRTLQYNNKQAIMNLS